MDDAFIRCSRRLRLRMSRRCLNGAPAAASLRHRTHAEFAPYRRRREEAAETALPRKADDALIPADEARFWYIRRRLRRTTPRSFAGTPPIALRSKPIACRITPAIITPPLG